MGVSNRPTKYDAWSGDTDASACSGVRTACTVFKDEPSPMAANATRFCFRTLRTKPLRVKDACLGGDGDELSVSSAAMLLAVTVELQRVCGRVASGRLRGRREARPRANNWLMDGRQTWSSQRAARREAWCSTIRRQRERQADRLLSRGAWAVVILRITAYSKYLRWRLAQMDCSPEPLVNRDKLHQCIGP